VPSAWRSKSNENNNKTCDVVRHEVVSYKLCGYRKYW
jgi:hypothetical protein